MAPRLISVIYIILWNASPTSTSEKEDKAMAGREPTTYGFERQRLTPTPLRPVVFCIGEPSIIWFINWNACLHLRVKKDNARTHNLWHW